MAALTATTGVTAKTTSAAPDCVTVVPGEHGYVPPGSCNGYYNFDPSFEGNLAFAVLFGVSLVGHVVQANAYKKVCFNNRLAMRLADLGVRHSAGSSSWVVFGRLSGSSFGHLEHATSNSHMRVLKVALGDFLSCA